MLLQNPQSLQTAVELEVRDLSSVRPDPCLPHGRALNPISGKMRLEPHGRDGMVPERTRRRTSAYCNKMKLSVIPAM